MVFIINPGSTIGSDPIGWTNTHATARRNAIEWFAKPMRKAGFTDIEMVDTGREVEGRWLFVFRHRVTKKEVELEVHGIDNIDAYEEQHIFTPRVYWDGSSTSSPALEQFRADGFVPIMTYRLQEQDSVT